MRFAVIADVLGNEKLFQAIYEDITSQGLKVGEIVCLGNLIGPKGNNEFLIEFGKQFALWLTGEWEEILLSPPRSVGGSLTKEVTEIKKNITFTNRNYVSALQSRCDFGQFKFYSSMKDVAYDVPIDKTDAQTRLIFTLSFDGKFVINNFQINQEHLKDFKILIEADKSISKIYSNNLAILSLHEPVEISLRCLLSTFHRNDLRKKLKRFWRLPLFERLNTAQSKKERIVSLRDALDKDFTVLWSANFDLYLPRLVKKQVNYMYYFVKDDQIEIREVKLKAEKRKKNVTFR